MMIMESETRIDVETRRSALTDQTLFHRGFRPTELRDYPTLTMYCQSARRSFSASHTLLRVSRWARICILGT